MTQQTRSREEIRADVLDLILDALKEVLRNKGKRLPALSAETTLYGQGSDVDSLGFVQVLVDVEQRVEARYGVSVSPTDDKAMSQRNSPFRTVGSLADFVTERVVSATG